MRILSWPGFTTVAWVLWCWTLIASALAYRSRIPDGTVIKVSLKADKGAVELRPPSQPAELEFTVCASEFSGSPIVAQLSLPEELFDSVHESVRIKPRENEAAVRLKLKKLPVAASEAKFTITLAGATLETLASGSSCHVELGEPHVLNVSVFPPAALPPPPPPEVAFAKPDVTQVVKDSQPCEVELPLRASKVTAPITAHLSLPAEWFESADETVQIANDGNTVHRVKLKTLPKSNVDLAVTLTRVDVPATAGKAAIVEPKTLILHIRTGPLPSVQIAGPLPPPADDTKALAVVQLASPKAADDARLPIDEPDTAGSSVPAGSYELDWGAHGKTLVGKEPLSLTVRLKGDGAAQPGQVLRLTFRDSDKIKFEGPHEIEIPILRRLLATWENKSDTLLEGHEIKLNLALEPHVASAQAVKVYAAYHKGGQPPESLKRGKDSGAGRLSFSDAAGKPIEPGVGPDGGTVLELRAGQFASEPERECVD